MSEENTKRYRLHLNHPPHISSEELARLDGMTDEEVEMGARSDPDALPLTDEELSTFKRVPDVRAIRKSLNLTQEHFAATFHLSLATVRDWEQARSQPDQAARAFLRVIEKEPDLVRGALESSP